MTSIVKLGDRSRRSLRRRKTATFAAAFCGLIVAVLPVAILPTVDARASGSIPADCTSPAATSVNGSTFSASETLCRTFFDQGLVDQRTFSATVSDTAGLRNGQVVTVSWTGAHPTGGIISAEQHSQAAQQEYPVVLMECRGHDLLGSPITPEDCWTASSQERSASASGGQDPPQWSLDMNNSAADQGTEVNVPSPVPQSCSGLVGDNYWVPFAAANGTVYPVGLNGCAGEPPEMISRQDPTIIPSDTTYAYTALNGTGTSKFTIATAETNASLGCSTTVPCSLVIVPIEGISCNANPAAPPQNTCESTGTFPPGSINTGGNPFPPAKSVTGSFWWSGSNWDRHISVPLNFATPADACKSSSQAPLQFYGSELLDQAAQQWNPYFCLGHLFNANEVQLAEPQAKRLLQQNEIEAAIQAAPPPTSPDQPAFFTTPTVQAPIAVSGFAISYVIDNADGTPYTKLQLDPRLLAKLLTESYYGTPAIQTGDTAISNNPQNIYADPEFQALNPTLNVPIGVQQAPAASLFSILTQSDVVWSLTSYISADPEARAWLDGRPDPWGMVVNPAYKGVQLPAESWPLLDTSTAGPDYSVTSNPFCYATLGAGSAREPDRPLIDNPQDTLARVAYNLEYAIAASLITCNNDLVTPTYLQLGAEDIGFRFLIGVVSLPQAREFDLYTASLQTQGPEVQTMDQAKFVAGRVFVAPDDNSLKSAASLLQPDPVSGSWAFPYGDFPGNPIAKNAYPGTTLISADVPTQGLSAQDAADYGKYLSFAVTDGQTPGSDVGQLPLGYLPMTTANGLGSEVAYTTDAAAAVAAQGGYVPSVTSPSPPPQPHAPPPATTTKPATSGAVPYSSSGYTGGLSAAGTSTGTAVANATPPTSSAVQLVQPAGAITRTPGFFVAGLGGLALPLAFGVAVLGGGLSAFAWWRRRKLMQP